MKALQVVDLGRCDYLQALDIQLELLQKRQQQLISDTLLFVEHPPVITLGNRASESHILASRQQLEQAGIQVYQIDRGGEVTYHGDGQLVGYTIVDLKNGKMGIRNFVCGLENAMISLLQQEFAIGAGRMPKLPGVWVGSEKIAALGLTVKRGVTMHGFALNVYTNLDHFQYIIPCGMTDKGVTSIEKRLGSQVSLSKVKQLLLQQLVQVFEYGQVKIDDRTKA